MGQQKNILLSKKINVYKNVSKEDFKKELDNKTYFEQIKSYYNIQDEYEQLYKFFEPYSPQRTIENHTINIRLFNSELEKFEKNIHNYIKEEYIKECNHIKYNTHAKCYNLFCIYEYILSTLSQEVESEIELYKQYIKNLGQLCYNKNISYSNDIIYKDNNFQYSLTNNTTMLCGNYKNVYDLFSKIDIINIAMNDFSNIQEKDIIRFIFNIIDTSSKKELELEKSLILLIQKISKSNRNLWNTYYKKFTSIMHLDFIYKEDYITKLIEDEKIYINRLLILDDLLAEG